MSWLSQILDSVSAPMSDSAENDPMRPRTYRDSLEAIAGKPRAYLDGSDFLLRNIYNPRQTAAGAYIPVLDVVRVRSGLPESAKREVMAHEYGHRIDFAGSDTRLRDAYASYLASHPEAQATGYAAKNGSEQFAEAFASAFRMLQQYAGKKDMSPVTARALRQSDSVPGKSAITKYLLSLPLYAGHPANSRPLDSR